MKERIKGKVIKEKNEMVKRKDKFKFGFLEAKADRRIFAMLFVEFIISIAIALSIYFYLDPEVKVEELKNVPFYLKLIAFIVLMGLLAIVFHKTKEFREERKTHSQP